ncbi:hypothetical protein FSP39_018702 [Pinctada imbricata]|uniref:Reverse transcriptase domain-containing protein n=1 Tax=Pinctada imbricata TaxID=66713 RepID=A0AA88XM33_PINIB|nr:hypothetical protein FSP39_018702 [Pinctada imbricata]
MIFPHCEQQGFQKGLGCLTASFNLQETVLHNLECRSNVYVGFIDTSKAFDTVWRAGLLVKLSKLGVKGRIWTLIDDCHYQTECSVIVNHTQSEWFEALQGVRQGGVLSTFLYLVFIDELIYSIERYSVNFGILNIHTSSPTLADDISLIAIQPNVLQSMLNCVYAYSQKWRFEFNVQKSCVLKFRALGNKMDDEFVWTLGGEILPVEDKYCHLGITISNNFRQTEHIKFSCSKAKKSYFALSDIGSPFLNPNTISQLYKRIVLQSALYGCELWHNLSCKDTQELNVFQHFICKNALDLPRRSRSDICEGLFDVLPIHYEIDKRKLLFFGRLCRMDNSLLPKKIFLTRLFSSIENTERKHTGFIPDILKTLSRYNLEECLRSWLSEGFFPGQDEWKKTIRLTLTNKFVQDRELRMRGDHDFDNFRDIFVDSSPASIWKIPTNSRELAVCRFIVKVIACISTQSDGITYVCELCCRNFCNIYMHAACSCFGTIELRNMWWEDVLKFDLNLCAELSGLDERDVFLVLLGKDTNFRFLNNDVTSGFKMLNFRYVKYACSLYHKKCRLLRASVGVQT